MSKIAAFLLFCLALAVGALFAGGLSGSVAVTASVALPLLGAWVILTAYDWIRADLALAAIGARRVDRPGFLSWPLTLLSISFMVLVAPYTSEVSFAGRLCGAIGLFGVWCWLDALNRHLVQAVTPTRAPCADPAECGSDWCAGIDVGSPTVAVACCRCGRTGMLEAEASAELHAAIAGGAAHG